MQIFLFLALILMGVTIIFAVQNTSTTIIRFLTWQTEGSLALVLLIATAAGALISFFFSLPTLVRDKWTVRSLKKKMNELEIEIDQKNTQLQETDQKIEESEEDSRIEVTTLEDEHPENNHLAEDSTIPKAD